MVRSRKHVSLINSVHSVVLAADVSLGPSQSMSVEILSTAAQLYGKKSNLKRLAIGE